MITCRSAGTGGAAGGPTGDLGATRVQATKAVRNFWARFVVNDLKARGIDAAAAVRKAGLEALALADEDGWIPFAKHAALLEVAANETGDDCYAARFATKVDVREAGALAYIGLASKSLEDALRNLERYSRVISEAVQVRLTLKDNTATLEGVADKHLLLSCGQALEFATSLLLTYYRACTGHRVTPIEIRFSHQRSGGVSELGRILGCPISFGCPRFEEVLKRTDLEIPIPSSDFRLLSILKKHAEAVLLQRGQNSPDLMQRLERRVSDLLPKGQARAKILASEMGMSERTFHRRLEEQGTTFAEVVDGLRHELAMKYVVDRHVSLTEVAFMLGYSKSEFLQHGIQAVDWQGPA